MQVERHRNWTGSAHHRQPTGDPAGFGRIRGLTRGAMEDLNSLPGPQQQAVAGAGRTASTLYLRAAQAYMLISMPTDTSTIFGVFQLIRVLPSSADTTFVPGRKLGSRWTERKYGRSKVALSARSPKEEVRSWASLLPSWTNPADEGRGIDACTARVRPITVRTTFYYASALVCRSSMTTSVDTYLQQSLSASVTLSPLAPSACCAAVGSPCICRCVSCEDAAVSPAARFILSVGGC
ncbi:hypothetical protein V1277_005220 [Bradyrhizobium sp. AZCC 1588]